jgi:hypothetical protein
LLPATFDEDGGDVQGEDELGSVMVIELDAVVVVGASIRHKQGDSRHRPGAERDPVAHQDVAEVGQETDPRYESIPERPLCPGYTGGLGVVMPAHLAQIGGGCVSQQRYRRRAPAIRRGLSSAISASFEQSPIVGREHLIHPLFIQE